MEAFMMTFDTDLAPVVGQQVTLTSSNAAEAGPRIQLLIDRAGADFTSKVLGGVVKECDLTATLVEAGVRRSFLFHPASGIFQPDDGEQGIDDSTLRAKAAASGQEVTYTCVPPGSGYRTALDRDEDELLNGFETNTGVFVSASDTGTDPALADTDGDGYQDGLEIEFGSDPNNALSTPNLNLPALSPLGVGGLALALIATRRIRRRRT